MKNDTDPVTKKEFREGLDEFAQMVNSSFEQVATKEDLKQCVTKQDLKDELKKFVTKDDLKEELKKFATKEDLKKELKNYATKEDIRAMNEELFERLDNSTFKQLHNHEIRIQKLEVRM